MLLLHAAAAFQFHENKCEPKTSLPTSEDSKRIAFILRGDAYRGLSYGSTARGSKRGFMCTPFAVRIQRAISASHVDYIIAPLEAAGFRVDVFFATYGCVENAEAQLERLKGFYDRNHTRVVHVDRIPRPGATQATPANIAMKSLRRLWPKEGYRSVLIWRFDLVATTPMGSKMQKLRPAGNTARWTGVGCEYMPRTPFKRFVSNPKAWKPPAFLPILCWWQSCWWQSRFVAHARVAFVGAGLARRSCRCECNAQSSDKAVMRLLCCVLCCVVPIRFALLCVAMICVACPFNPPGDGGPLGMLDPG